MQRICVYAGSNPGHDPAYARAAVELAREAVSRGLGIVSREVKDFGGKLPAEVLAFLRQGEQVDG